MLGSPFVEQCRADERHLSFDVRPWCNVPVAGFNTKTAPRVTQRRRTRALCFWGGGAAREPVTRARRGACCARTLLRGRAACRREAFPLRRVALVRHASCGLQRQASAVRHVQRTSSKEEAQHLIPLFARAVPPWFWSSPHLRKALRRLEASLLRHAPVVRCASCGPQHQASTACHSTQAHLISPSLERRRSTRACFSHAPWRAGCGRKSLRRRPACRREASLLRRPAVVQHASCGLQHQASAACHSAEAHLRSLCLRRRRCSRAFYARAPWRTGCARKALRRRAPCRREPPPLRRAAVVRRASCGLQR